MLGGQLRTAHRQPGSDQHAVAGHLCSQQQRCDLRKACHIALLRILAHHRQQVGHVLPPHLQGAGGRACSQEASSKRSGCDMG